jgi:glycosyltransferase involved in cell wall biosynthesis
VKILLVSHGSELGGGGEFVFLEAVRALRNVAPHAQLLTVFPANGRLLEAAVEAGAKGYVASLPRWADFESHLLNTSWPRVTFRIVRSVARACWFVSRHRPSIVVTNTMVVPSFAIAARLFRLPHMWMVQEFGDRDHGMRFLLGYGRTIRSIGALSDTVICCSCAVRDRLLEAGLGAPTRVVYYGIARPAVGSRARDAGPLQAALVGRFSEAKGQETAVSAVAMARRQGADIELTLVGPETEPGAVSRVRTLAKDLGIEKYVRVRSELVDPASVWSASHVALMCSRDEAFGRVTVEAMKAGLPVLGASSGGTREIVFDGVNGFLFPPDDDVSLSVKLMRLAADEGLRMRLARGAIESAAAFSEVRYGQELFRAIAETSAVRVRV